MSRNRNMIGTCCNVDEDMGVSKYRGTHKSSILTGFSIINHPFSGTPIFGNTHMVIRESADFHFFFPRMFMFFQVPGSRKCGLNDPPSQMMVSGGDLGGQLGTTKKVMKDGFTLVLVDSFS